MSKEIVDNLDKMLVYARMLQASRCGYGTKEGDGKQCDCKYLSMEDGPPPRTAKQKRWLGEQNGCCEARALVQYLLHMKESLRSLYVSPTKPAFKPTEVQFSAANNTLVEELIKEKLCAGGMRVIPEMSQKTAACIIRNNNLEWLTVSQLVSGMNMAKSQSVHNLHARSYYASVLRKIAQAKSLDQAIDLSVKALERDLA